MPWRYPVSTKWQILSSLFIIQTPAYLSHLFCFMGIPESLGTLIVLQHDSSCFILYLSRCFYLLLSRMTQSHVLHSILWIPVWLKHCAACIVQRFYRTVVPIVESALALQNDSPLLRVPCLYKMTALFITFHNPDPLTFPICSFWWASLKDYFWDPLLFYKMIARVLSCIFQDAFTYSYLEWPSLMFSTLFSESLFGWSIVQPALSKGSIER